MQEDALHVLVVVGVTMSMVVISVIMRMSMPVVCMAKGCEAYNVDEEAEDTDNQKFVQSLELMTLPQPLKGIEDDLYTDKSRLCY